MRYRLALVAEWLDGRFLHPLPMPGWLDGWCYSHVCVPICRVLFAEPKERKS